MNDAANGRRGALPPGVSHSSELSVRLREGDYLAGEGLSTAIFLALKLGRPLFLEGEAGVGKTEIAKVLSAALGRRLIRLQCYEGLDVASAVYEWNSASQMIAIRLAEATGDADRDQLSHDIFGERYLIKRPLRRNCRVRPRHWHQQRLQRVRGVAPADVGFPELRRTH